MAAGPYERASEGQLASETSGRRRESTYSFGASVETLLKLVGVGVVDGSLLESSKLQRGEQARQRRELTF